MNNSQAILNLLERTLGKSEKKSRNNYAFQCPFHKASDNYKKKLEINIETQQWGCWVCGNINGSKGRYLSSLFKKLKVSSDKIKELNFLTGGKSNSYIQENVYFNIIQLPEEFISLYEDLELEKLGEIKRQTALNYLKSRKITELDIIKYNIGFCYQGRYENRIIIPSYDSEGKLNYFCARDFTNTLPTKYDKPFINLKEIIPYELFINWNVPVILCEGEIDSIFLRNSIPLLGKNISEAIIKKLIISKTKKVYVCLDKDAIIDSIQYCEQLLKHGCRVYFVELKDGKDPADVGRIEMVDILENTQELTFKKLIELKLNIL